MNTSTGLPAPLAAAAALGWGAAAGPLRTLGIALLVAYVVVGLGALLWADRLIFQPPPPSYDDGLGITKLMTDDGVAISAVYLPNPRAEHTILYSHGNAEDLGHIRPSLEAIRDLGFGVFAYDYRGYGTSENGPPSEEGTYRDIEAAYDHLTAALGVPPSRIIVLGVSVGSGPAVELASRRQVGGLVLEGAFTSAFRVLTRFRIYPFDRYANLAKLPRIGAPVLVIHGTDDDVIPFHHGRKLYRAARGPKWFLPISGARHNDLRVVAGERYGRALREFAAATGRAASTPA